MNVLAFDTCLGAVSAAAGRHGPDGWRLHEACETRASGHVERLLPLIWEVMDGAGLDFAALDRIAVTAGPGGFTGVRAGIATARALALATGKPVVAATSLAVMAHRAEAMLAATGEPLGTRRLVVAVDARRGTLYVQSFAPGTIEAGEPLLLTPQEAAGTVGREGAVVVGSAAEAVATLVREAGGDAEPRLPDLQPHARSLAVLAPGLAPAAPVRPLYLRPPDVRPQDGGPLAQARS